jgi:hypothetical protein
VGFHHCLTSRLRFLSAAPQAIRLQVAHTFDTVLTIGPRQLTVALSDLQGAVQRRVLDDLTRSYKYLATPDLSDGKPSLGARLGLPARTFDACCARSARVWRVVQADSGVSTSTNSPDYRPDIDHLSPVLEEETKTCLPFSWTPLRVLLYGQHDGHYQRN